MITRVLFKIFLKKYNIFIYIYKKKKQLFKYKIENVNVDQVILKYLIEIDAEKIDLYK